jgi:internalin A
MTDQAQTVSRRPWRKFLRLSVRGLLVLVLVIGAWLGWLVRSAHIQRDAVAAIEQAGGHVAYESPFVNGQFIPDYAPYWSRWIVKGLGIDYFAHPVRVRLAAKATDESMVHVRRLAGPFQLFLSMTEITDAGLVHLEGVPNLSELILANTQVTDAGLIHLKGQSNLRALAIPSTATSDAGLVHLSALTNLSDLSLSNTQVTDAGLVHLKALTNLTDLNLSSTQVTDAGLEHLKALINLSNLGLRGTRVTDGGIQKLKQALPRLTISR